MGVGVNVGVNVLVGGKVAVGGGVAVGEAAQAVSWATSKQTSTKRLIALLRESTPHLLVGSKYEGAVSQAGMSKFGSWPLLGMGYGRIVGRHR